jgi:filamentous hemagglutinin family protein
VVGLVVGSFDSALAQLPANQGLVVRDGTLGSEPAGIVPGGADPLNRSASYLITPEHGYREPGSSTLFHSFDRFSIGAGETATFTGDASLRSIVSRVTGLISGGEESRIDGTLRSTAPNADLYLLNPKGVIFGAGARLDVPASFHVSTADQLELVGGGDFEATPGEPASLISVADSASFGFLGSNHARIVVEPGGFLAVYRGGESISLVGNGPVSVAGELNSEGGRVRIEGGETVDIEGTILSFAGEISIAGSRVGVGGGVLIAQDGGLVELKGTEVELTDARVEAPGINDGYGEEGGTVWIEATDSLIVTRSQVSAQGYGKAAAGSVVVQAPDAAVILGDHSFLGSASFAWSGVPGGPAGSIDVTARTLVVTGGSQISAVSLPSGLISSGDAGDIRIHASESVRISNEGGGPVVYSKILRNAVDFTAVAATSIGAAGRAGMISIDAPRITITDNAVVSSSSLRGGSAVGDGVAGSVLLGTEGTTERVEVLRGALLDASTSSAGAGGEVRVVASEAIRVAAEDGLVGRIRSGTLGAGRA